MVSKEAMYLSFINFEIPLYFWRLHQVTKFFHIGMTYFWGQSDLMNITQNGTPFSTKVTSTQGNLAISSELI